MSAPEEAIAAEDFFLLLGALLETRRAALRKRFTLAFAVVDAGAFVLDTSRPSEVTRAWRNDASVSVVCNRRTLSDMVRGEFDVGAPKPEHLFLWGGDEEAWSVLATALGGAKTLFDARLDSLRR